MTPEHISECFLYQNNIIVQFARNRKCTHCLHKPYYVSAWITKVQVCLMIETTTYTTLERHIGKSHGGCSFVGHGQLIVSVPDASITSKGHVTKGLTNTTTGMTPTRVQKRLRWWRRREVKHNCQQFEVTRIWIQINISFCARVRCPPPMRSL